MFRVCMRVDLGRKGYQEVWDLQRRLVPLRQAGAIPDVLLFVEHPPTYTLGRAAKREHVLVSEDELQRIGARLIHTDRGGDVTFHGEGQLVGYPILNLAEMQPDVHVYLRRLEEVIIQALARFGVEANRQPGLTGVWHPEGKLAAIGVRVARWVTSHGFALNVSTDLEYFKRIVPCGIVDRQVASMESVGQPTSLAEVANVLSGEFGRVFDRVMLSRSVERLLRESHVEIWKAAAS
ncbi:MAG: lipoyl(octanoyl) transferase LipB [Vicinamibacteria bacterium]